MGHGAAASARRAALLEAAIELIGLQGPRAVTHRSVAAAAGVPAATTGYYFASREQLVDEALRTLAEREDAGLRARHALVSTPTVDGIAAALTAWLVQHADGAGATAALAQHQLQVEAARRPELAGDHAAKARIDALAEETLRALGAADPAAAAVLLVSAIDGLQLRLLTQPPGERDDRALQTTIRLLLVALTR